MDVREEQRLREKLIRQIEDAFSNVIYERVSWHENPSWQLQSKHWREAPLDMLKRDGFVFGLPISEDGQFFLPAYMALFLRIQKRWKVMNRVC